MNDLIFTFYPSYYQYAKDLPAKERLAFYDAVLRYFFEGEECDARNPAYKVFMLVKPNITSSMRMKAARRSRNTSRNTCPNTSRNTCPNTSRNTCPNTSPNTCPNTSPNTCPNTSSIGTKEQRNEGTKDNTPPPTPAPSGPGAAAAALRHSCPTLGDVLEAARNMAVPEDFARRFHADMERDNWAYVNRHGATATVNRLCLASVLGGRWRASRRGGAADGAPANGRGANQPDGVVHHEEGYENPL